MVTTQSFSVAGEMKTSERKSLPSDSCSEAYGSFSSVPNARQRHPRKKLALALGSTAQGLSSKWAGAGEAEQGAGGSSGSAMFDKVYFLSPLQ